jgi:hypothetical protein
VRNAADLLHAIPTHVFHLILLHAGLVKESDVILGSLVLATTRFLNVSLHRLRKVLDPDAMRFQPAYIQAVIFTENDQSRKAACGGRSLRRELCRKLMTLLREARITIRDVLLLAPRDHW